MTKDFGLIFLLLSSVTNLGKQFIGVHKVFWHLLWKSNFYFFGYKMLLKAQTFEKKRQSLQWRKDFGLFFLVLSSVTNFRGSCIGV